jgi:hypothetical protein
VERTPATEPEGKNVGATRSADSIHSPKPEVVPTEAIQGVVPAAIASVAQSLPAAESLGAAAHSTDVKEQSSRPSLVIDLPTAATASLNAQASAAERPSVAAAAKTAPRESTQEWVPASQREPIPPSTMPSGFSGPLPSTTESPQPQQNVVPQAAKVPQEGDEFDKHAAGGNLTQALSNRQRPAQADAPEPRPTQAAASNQNSMQRPVVIPNQERALTSSQNVAPRLPAPNPIPAQEAGSSLTPMPTEALSENSIQRIAANQNEVPMQPVKQGSSVSPASSGNEPLDSLQVAVHAAASSNQTSAPPQTVKKPGPAASEKISTPNTSRPARELGNLDAAVPGGRIMERQPFVPAVNLSAMAHDLSGAHGAIGKAAEPAGASASTASGPDSRETFATLDAVSATGKPILIHAAPQRAEAGFHDPALGWVGVRADTSGGAVHAELVPGSADAAQALGSHLAGLNAYLAEHHTPVETLTLSLPESEGAELGGGQSAGQGAEQGAGQGTQPGSGQQTGQEPAQGAESGSPSVAAMHSTALPAASAGLLGGLHGSTPAGRPGGVHISVMA